MCPLPLLRSPGDFAPPLGSRVHHSDQKPPPFSPPAALSAGFMSDYELFFFFSGNSEWATFSPMIFSRWGGLLLPTPVHLGRDLPFPPLPALLALGRPARLVGLILVFLYFPIRSTPSVKMLCPRSPRANPFQSHSCLLVTLFRRFAESMVGHHSILSLPSPIAFFLS